MNYTITNQNLSVEISNHGAEIKAVKYMGTDYLHDSNPKYWNRSAPILFPNIGTIKDNVALFNNVGYPMKKHGFLRDRDFTLDRIETSSATFSYESTSEDLSIYPFSFKVTITYQIHGSTLKSYILVKNLSNEIMPFNLGLHPAFKVPLSADENFEDYKFIFDEAGTYDCPAVNLTNGTIDFNTVARHFDNLKELPLNYDDYQNDALVFDNLATHRIHLVNKDKTHGVSFEFNDFPMLGIWTPNHVHANFICIEPWIGCADPSDHDNVFTNKRYLINLNPNDEKLISYQIKFF